MGETVVGRYLAREIPRLLIRLGLAFTVYGLIGAVRWPEQLSGWVAVLSFGGLAAAIIVLCGKLLYDTFYPVQSQARQPYFYPKDRR